MTQVPTNRTAANSVAEHTSDHNIFAAQHNELDGHAADTAAHDVDATIAAAIDALVAAAPGTLDTLNELAAALGDDADFAATITTALAGKSATGHGHAESDVTSLVSDLAGKAATGHTHAGVYDPAGTTATHEADTTSVHGIADTAALSLTSHTHGGTYEPVATAHHARHEPGGADAMAVDAAAATGSLRTLGTGATQAAVGSHAHSGTYELVGVATTADAAHVAAADPHTGYVLESLVDAAGDLLVGTANDTVGRLALGTALYVLRVNAAGTALEYAAASAGGSDMTFARMAFR